MSAITSSQPFFWSVTPTPLGKIALIADEESLYWVGIPGKPIEEGKHWILRHVSVDSFKQDDKNSVLKQTSQALISYFEKKKDQFSIPQFNSLGTPFQKAVWKEISRIPFGETKTYQEIAESIGKKDAVRAVGTACGKNPISTLIPCHRVVGSNGGLGGYGGGLEMKQWLLKWEG